MKLRIQYYNNISALKLIGNTQYFLLEGKMEVKEYVDGKPTDKIIGSKYKVIRPENEEEIYVKIKDGGKSLKHYHEGDRVLFENLHGRFYVNNNNYLDLSIQADDIEMYEEL